MSARCIVLMSFIFFATIDVHVNGQPAPFFRKDYEFDQVSQAFYKLHTEKRKWGDAVFTCTSEGAQLATPLTEGEMGALLLHMKNVTESVYLGIHDFYVEGEFVTISGIPVKHIFTNWRQHVPDNSGGNEDCVEMISDGLYNDINCDLPRDFICKKDLSTLINNSVCETYDTDYKYSIETGHCYKFHATPRNWKDAYKICSAEDSHLGIINSDVEAAIYKDIFKVHFAESTKINCHTDLIHLGFSDLFTLGDFKTIDGKSLVEAGYDKWACGQPDNGRGGERCGSMFRDGTLNNFVCEMKAKFICEKQLGKFSSHYARLGSIV